MATTFADLSPLAKLVLYLESLPDPDEAPVTTAAQNRTDLRDRMGQIITIDRAGTPRSVSASN